MTTTDPDKERGTDYADGGVAGLQVHYPSPERIAHFHRQWASVTFPTLPADE